MVKLNLPVEKKVEWVLAWSGAKRTEVPFVARFGGHKLVCVQSNGAFDAAWVPENQNEVREVIESDPRPRTWLEVPNEVIGKWIAEGFAPPTIFATP